MSSPSAASQTSGSGDVNGATEPCPLTECEAVVYCIDGQFNALVGVDAQVAPQGPKPTDKMGTADFEHLKPPDQDYTATATLKGDTLKKFIWRDSDGATATMTQFIAGADTVLFKFKAIALARPEVKVLWAADNKAVAKVGVKLKPDTGAEYTLKDTGDDGIAKLGDGDAGVKPATYQVQFPTGLEHCVVVEDPGIAVPEGGTDQYVFHARKFKVSFQLKDQFGKEVTGLDWVMHYPDGSKKDSGTLADTDKGLVEKDQVPDGTYKFAAKLLYQPQWEYKRLEIDKDVKLAVKATGFDPGTDVKFDIYDSSVLTGAALDTVSGKTPDEADRHDVEVTWKPDATKLKNVTSGAVVFVASAGGKKTMSSPRTVRGKQTFDVKGATGNALEATVGLAFSGQAKVFKKTVKSTGGKAEVMVPLGSQLLYAHLTKRGGQVARFTDTENNTQGYFVP